MSPPSIDDKPSWVTTRKGQIIAAIVTGLCIFLAFLAPTLYVKSESDKRADADRAARIRNDNKLEQERIDNDERITTAQVNIACAFIRGLEKAFKPGVLTGNEDEQTRDRINTNNAQRAEAIKTVRGEMPPDIVGRINKVCPPEPDSVLSG